MTDAPRYSTLRDYLRVLRSNRLTILVAMLLVGLIALVVSIREPKVYAAEASIAFSDPIQDLQLLGLPLGPRQPANERRTAGADLVERQRIVKGVARQLKREDVAALEAAVTARPEAQTNFVVIEAQWTDPTFAARLANAYAREVRRVATRDERAELRRIANALRDEYDKAAAQTRDPNLKTAFAERVTRVEALRAFAEPVEIAKTAGIPDAAISPKPIRNTLLGLLLGFSLGVLFAFGRDALDRRVTSSRDVQRRLGLPLLAELSDEALGTSPESRNGNRPLPNLDREAIRILRSNLGFLAEDASVRTLLVTSAMPEEGKTTVASSIATAAAAAAQKTLLLECDLRRPSIADRLHLAAVPGLTDVLRGKAAFADVVQTLDVRGAPLPLDVVTGGKRHERPAELLASVRMKALLDEARAEYDLIVLDATPLLSVADARELVPLSDGIVLCVRPGRTTSDQVDAARAALDQMPDRPTGLVATGLSRDELEASGYYAYAS